MNDTLTKAECEQRISELEAENIILKHEFDAVRVTLEKTELEKEHMAQLISALEREKQYHVGQIEAFKFCITKGGDTQ